MGVGGTLDGDGKLGCWRKRVSVVYRRLKLIIFMREGGKKVSPPCDIQKTISGPALFVSPPDKKSH